MGSIMIIYRTTNLINGKVYIGKDKHNNPNYFGSGKLIQAAIKKYGVDNFQKEILEYCDSVDQLAFREIVWIEHFNSTNRKIGYNMTIGGLGGNTRINYTDQQMNEYKNKLSEGLINSEKYANSVKSKVGKPRPEHSRKMIELYATGKLVPHNLGKSASEATRKKISAATTGKTRTDEQKNKISISKYKAIDQFDMDGNFIKTHQSIKHASIENSVGRDSIYGCCVGKYTQGGGYKWKYSVKL